MTATSAKENEAPRPWIRTPCIRSSALSLAAGCNVFLKLDNLQPSGSFKSRGIGNLMLRAVQSQRDPHKPIHFYCSSGGNAGIACATTAISLNKPATIVVPTSTSSLMIQKLKTLDADIHQCGANWFEADSYLRTELLEKDPSGVYVPPFDHKDIWQGAATMIDEIDEQIGNYDGVVCSVGGGGMLCGIMEGLSKRKQCLEKPVKVLAVETEGADSFHQSAKRRRHITLDGINSIATSLGAIRVADRAFQWLSEYNGDICTLALSDAEAALGSVRFADDERILAEVSCGVSIATAYGGQLRDVFGSKMSDAEWAAQRIVIIVCGGNNITLELLESYRKRYCKRSATQKKIAEAWNKADRPGLCSHTPFSDNGYEDGWNGAAQTTMNGYAVSLAPAPHPDRDLDSPSAMQEDTPEHEPQFEHQFEQHVHEREYELEREKEYQLRWEEYQRQFKRLQLSTA